MQKRMYNLKKIKKMGKEVTLGGDRLGSGNKNKQELHNYYRSTHNLSQKWTSSMGAGILYPFLVLPAMRGDNFQIDLHADARTIPTQGALFGSFKMQVDLFQCPVRLYQAILHNNPTAIGLKMNQVMFPKIDIESFGREWTEETANDGKFSNSCLMKYLGISGIGTIGSHAGNNGIKLHRTFNAIPLLAYYDIFKNYYSNKQEEDAYVLSSTATPTSKSLSANYTEIEIITSGAIKNYILAGNVDSTNIEALTLTDNSIVTFKAYFGKNTKFENAIECGIVFENTDASISTTIKLKDLITLSPYTPGYSWKLDTTKNFNVLSIYGCKFNDIHEELKEDSGDWENILPDALAQTNTSYNEIVELLKIESFKLKNIDDMRMAILSHNNLGTPFFLGLTNPRNDWTNTSGTDLTGKPYSVNFSTYQDKNGNYVTKNKFPLNGLMLKTYQSDLYNNWILTDWIDGENGIAAITAISTADGSFTMDALNLAEKLYNMLNRIAVSGNTYEDWQDAVYTESPRRHIESPVFLGGMSSEIMFEEIVQTAPTQLDGGLQALGTLGGRGRHIKKKGGHVNVKIDEASFIIGIVSLTPRIVYTQGNEWYMTDLLSMDDFHKPALDGIGYEDLIAERMAWWNTKYNSTSQTYTRSKIGKVPAWINYMTAVDKAFGDFAETEGYGYMVLNRNYEMGASAGDIKDATTYVDPQKYNYAFAYTDLDAQNFWVQIYSDIKARRLMSAKQIPNI